MCPDANRIIKTTQKHFNVIKRTQSNCIKTNMYRIRHAVGDTRVQ